MPESNIKKFFDALLREFVMVDEEGLDSSIFAVDHPMPEWSTPEHIEHERETMGMWPRVIEKTQVTIETLCELAPFAIGAVTDEDIDLDDICRKHLVRLDEIRIIAKDFVKEKGIEEPTVEEWVRIALEEGAR